MPAVLEATMLLAFSISWYFSIWTTLTSQSPEGKSVAFNVVTMVGLFCGIAAKLAYYSETGQLSALVYLYSWNFLLAGIDTSLAFCSGGHWRRRRPDPTHTFIPETATDTPHGFLKSPSQRVSVARQPETSQPGHLRPRFNALINLQQTMPDAPPEIKSTEET